MYPFGLQSSRTVSFRWDDRGPGVKRVQTRESTVRDVSVSVAQSREGGRATESAVTVVPHPGSPKCIFISKERPKRSG